MYLAINEPLKGLVSAYKTQHQTFCKFGFVVASIFITTDKADSIRSLTLEDGYCTGFTKFLFKENWRCEIFVHLHFTNIQTWYISIATLNPTDFITPCTIKRIYGNNVFPAKLTKRQLLLRKPQGFKFSHITVAGREHGWENYLRVRQIVTITHLNIDFIMSNKCFCYQIFSNVVCNVYG